MLNPDVLFEAIQYLEDPKSFALVSKQHYQSFRTLHRLKIQKQRLFNRQTVLARTEIIEHPTTNHYGYIVFKNYASDGRYLGFEKYYIGWNGLFNPEAMEFDNLFGTSNLIVIKANIYNHLNQYLIVYSTSFTDHYYVPNPDESISFEPSHLHNVINGWKVIPDGPSIIEDDDMPINHEMYKMGVKDGVQRYWNRLGKLKVEETFVNGKRHGIRRVINVKGELKQELYENGRLVEYETLEDLETQLLFTLCKAKGLNGKIRRIDMIEFLKQGGNE